jgi:hypothetical protein
LASLECCNRAVDTVPHQAPRTNSPPPLHACRRARVAELLKQAGCPEGFRFANPEGFDLGAKLRQSEPHKSLLSGPLPSRRVDLTAAPPAAPPTAPAPGVLAEQPANQHQPPVPRRSGFQVPTAKSGQGRSHQLSVAASFGRQEQQQQQPQQGPPSGRQQASAAAQSQGRQPPQDGRWSAKIPRRAHDAHVGHGRRGHTHGGGADDESSVESGEDEGYPGQEQAQGRSIPGFQTAKSKLISDLRQKGQQYNPSSGGGGGGGGAPPRPGLARPAGAGSRPAGLRKTGERCQVPETGSQLTQSRQRQLLDLLLCSVPYFPVRPSLDLRFRRRWWGSGHKRRRQVCPSLSQKSNRSAKRRRRRRGGRGAAVAAHSRDPAHRCACRPGSQRLACLPNQPASAGCTAA